MAMAGEFESTEDINSVFDTAFESFSSASIVAPPAMQHVDTPGGTRTHAELLQSAADKEKDGHQGKVRAAVIAAKKNMPSGIAKSEDMKRL